MPRALSTEHIRALLDPHSAVFPLIFLKISHAQLPEPIRVVNDFTQYNKATDKPVPYLLGGANWNTFPFALELFGDAEDPPQGRLTIPNVDRRIGQALDALVTPLAIIISIYTSTDFAINAAGTRMEPVGTPVVQYETPTAFLREIQWDGLTVSGAIKPYDPTLEQWPFLRATPDVAPALWM